MAAPLPAVESRLAAALERQRRGELEAAAEAYREILAETPEQPDALHLLGVVCFQQGNPGAAVPLIRRAIARNDAIADYHANLGAAYQALARDDEADASYRRALALNPRQVETLNNLAILCERGRRLDEAIACCRRVLAVDHANLKALRKLSDLLLATARYEEAAERLAALTRLSPGEAKAWNSLGYAHDRCERLDEALRCYRRAVELDGGSPEFLSNLGILLRRLGQGAEADSCFARAKDADPAAWTSELHRARWLASVGDLDAAIALLLGVAEAGSEDVETLIGLGATLCSAKRYKEAHRWLVRALELQPDNADAMYFLGSAFMGMKEGQQAEAAFRKALEFRPGYVQPHLSICEIMDVMQRRDEATMWGRASLYLEGFTPSLMVFPFKAFRGSCDLESIEALGDIWAAAEAALPTGGVPAVFLYLLVEADTVEKAKRLTALHRASAERFESMAARNPLPPLAPRRREGRLRVGLLSHDLRNHSVANFVRPLLRNYDRDRLEIVAYSLLREPDCPVQAEIRGLVDRFVDVEVETDRALAEFVRKDEVDALVDLGGFTVGSRLTALAYRMAPIQITWLGYPYTTGFKEVDYVLVDPYVRPTAPELFVEKPLVMPHSWLCYEGYAEEPIDSVPPCERNGYVTFGTLNNTYKFNRGCIAAWAEVLRAVPGSRFLLVRPEGQTRIVAENLAKAFALHGIGPERLFIRTNRPQEHLRAYNQIDIALDSFPVTGGTTTCDALWMGVPTVSLRGPSMHQRVSHSALMQANLGELSSDDPAAFVRTAVALAGEPESLRLLRRTLREAVRGSPLFRGDLFAAGFCGAIEQAARERGLR
jgi:predicted O-linked N-acetylglucosamine transferase (SPINDLY family)